MSAARAPRPAALLSLCALALMAFALASCASSSATTTPPPIGDWTIDVGESSSLEGTLTLVIGNITVNGSLDVGNGTLELVEPAPGVSPWMRVNGPGKLTLFNATLTAGTMALGPAYFTLDSTAGATVTASRANFFRLDATAQGNLTGVGMHLAGTSVTLTDSVVDLSLGGIGLSNGSALSGTNLSLTVQGRALFLTGGASATLDGLTASGLMNATDYVVLVDRSTLNVFNASISSALAGALILASDAWFTNVTFGTVGDVDVLMLGSNVTLRGGAVVPHSRIGLEAYASSVFVSGTAFHNFTYGVMLVESSILLEGAAFDASTRNPLGAFADVYGFNSLIRLRNSTFDGRYIQTWIPVNNTTVPVYSCSTSSIFAVHSVVNATNIASTCFSHHYDGEHSDLSFTNWTMDNGTIGLYFFAGSVNGQGATATNFTGSGIGIVISFFRTAGVVSDIVSLGNDLAVEFTDSTALVENLTTASPGLGVRVVSGSPTINGSTFTVHNGTSVLVKGGSPLISNSTFWLTADRVATFAVFIEGGSPRIAGNTIHGSYTFTYGVRTTVDGAARVEGNLFESLDRGAIFHSTGFLLANNTFLSCYVGADSEPGSSGRMVGNQFLNLTELGQGSGVRLYFAATVVEGNTFLDVNYGVQILYSPSTAGSLGTRVSGNYFDTVRWFAVQVLNATNPVLIDNNTVLHATAGAVELWNASVVGSYNVFFDSDGYGYTAVDGSLTLVGDRLENLTTGVLGNQTAITASYTTVARTHIGIIVQDGALRLLNCSFQFNGIAVEIVNRESNEIADSIFVANVESVLVYSSASVTVRDTSFVGTIDAILENNQASTGRVVFTRHGELNGGRLHLAGSFESTAPSLTLKSLDVSFVPGPGVVSGARIESASPLAVSGVRFSGAFYFELANVSGSFAQVAFRGVSPRQANGSVGLLLDNATLTLRDVSVNDSSAAATAVRANLTVANLTVRDNNATGLFLLSSRLSGAALAVLDNAGCGIRGAAGSVLAVTNLTVRANLGGSLCFEDSQANVTLGDLASGAPDVRLEGASDVFLVSTTVLRGWQVNDTSTLTVAWVLTVRVNHPNAAELPAVTASVVDGRGRAFAASPSTDGEVRGLPPFPQWIATAGGNESRNPYAVYAGLRSSSASATLDLTRDTSVQLDLTDTTPPTVVIESPASGDGFAYSNLTLRFRALDNGSGLKDLQYHFGAGASTAVPTTGGPVEILRELVDGVHTFTVRATDFSGNAAEAAVNFTVDTHAPLITVVSPKPSPYHTRAASLTIQVTVEPDVVALTIGTALVPVVLGAASLSVDLPEGTSEIVIAAQDRVGNRANVSVTIVADRTPPDLVVDNAAGPNVTVESFLVVSGTTERGALVMVGGYPVVASNGTFQALVFLDEGRNDIEVRARDDLGNENVTRFTVTRGVLAPSHVFDTIALFLGMALLLASAGLGYFVYSRQPVRRPEELPAPPRDSGPGGGPP